MSRGFHVANGLLAVGGSGRGTSRKGDQVGNGSRKTRYLIEAYAIQRAVEVEQERAALAARFGAGVRYVRSSFVPGDRTIFHVFEAPSLAALRRAARDAMLQCDRIVAVIERSPSGLPG